jgi:hypothetical protein
MQVYSRRRGIILEKYRNGTISMDKAFDELRALSKEFDTNNKPVQGVMMKM